MMFAPQFYQNVALRESDTYMPPGYIPGEKDVLCGRGRTNAKHPGNKKFMQVIRSNLKLYTDAPSRMQKSVVVSSVVHFLLDAGLRFLKFDRNCDRYVELCSERTHDKVGHAIRDLLKANKKSAANKAARSPRQKVIPDAVQSVDESCLFLFFAFRWAHCSGRFTETLTKPLKIAMPMSASVMGEQVGLLPKRHQRDFKATATASWLVGFCASSTVQLLQLLKPVC